MQTITRLFLIFLFIEGKEKSSALAGLRFYPDISHMSFYDLFADGQPNTSSGVFFFGYNEL